MSWDSISFSIYVSTCLAKIFYKVPVPFFFSFFGKAFKISVVLLNTVMKS